MANKIVLISDDENFYDYIKLKLELRKSDELFTCSFDEVPEKMDFLESSVLIINSENSRQKTLDMLKLFQGTTIIVTVYNDDDVFKKKCYRAGALDFITLLTSDSEFRVRIFPALSVSSILEKNRQYRKILVKNKIISKHNEVFVDCDNIIDNALDELKQSKREAVFAVISPDSRSKFLIKPNTLETMILANIRKNDILMNYEPDKYYLIMYDTNVESSEKLWKKISEKFQYKVYAGIVQISNKNRHRLITSALNKLHEEFNKNDKGIYDKTGLKNPDATSPYANFKLFRKEFAQKLEQIINPVFYTVRQKYLHKLTGVKIELDYGDGFATFYIIGKHSLGEFKMSCPGYTKILVDISLKQDSKNVDTKRITFEPDELEAGMLNDLLEQFVSEANTHIN